MTPMTMAKFRAMRNFATVVLAGTIAACAPAPVRIDATAPDAQAQCAPVALAASTRFSAERFETGLPQSGQWRDGFALADMNADGHLDLLHGPARKGKASPSIFLGDGSGRFTLWKDVHYPPLPYDYGDIQAADFNGDGRNDIAISSHLRGLAVLINEAPGFYAPWGEGLAMRLPADVPDALAFASRNIAAVDWNGDGRPDLLALNEGPSRLTMGASASESLQLFINRSGLWALTPARQLFNTVGDTLAIGDINGDGLPDALIGTQFEGARLLLQIGDGVSYLPRELHSLPARATVTAVDLADLDHDGRDEVIHATRSVEQIGYCTALHVVYMAADDSETQQTLWREPSKNPLTSLQSADLDGDGHGDLIALRQHGGIRVYAGSAQGFSRDISIETPVELRDCDVFDSELADLDGDGALEFIVSYAGEATGVTESTCRSGGGFAAWHLRRR